MTESRLGVLYLIGAGEVFNLPVKIGISINPDDRLSTLQTSHWLELKIHFRSKPVTNVSYLEEWLHFRYDHLRIRGEWFTLTLDEYVSIVQFCENFAHISESKQKRLPKMRRHELPHTPSNSDRALAIVEYEEAVRLSEKQEADLRMLTLAELEKRHILDQASRWYQPP
jgi:hypothetical protein